MTELPIGEGGKLNKLAQEQWREHLLLFSQVKNKVLEVNPNFDLPFDLEEGKPTSLGLFAEAAFSWRRPGRPPKGKQVLEVWPEEHHRAALLGRIIFGDSRGRLYRDIDLKGMGAIDTAYYRWPIGQRASIVEQRRLSPPSQSGVQGLLDRDVALFDWQISERFLNAGIRTHGVLAVIQLEEIITDGHKISLQEATKRNVIVENFQPVIEVRAFGTKARLYGGESYNLSESEKEDRNLFLADAKKLVSQELGEETMLSTEEYLLWFAKTLGTNTALMHRSGWFHDYLHEHNITLDCRIVDLDSITRLTSEKERKKDVDRAELSFTRFLGYLSLDLRRHDICIGQFLKSYESTFPPSERKRYFSRALKEE